MAEVEHSCSDSDENSQESSSGEEENVSNGGQGGVPEYEKQRLERIKENRARLEALRLPTLASSLLGSVEKKEKRRKGKNKKEEDDEEYKPSEHEEKQNFSSEEGEEEDEEIEESSSGSASARKGKRKQYQIKSTKKRSVQNPVRKLDFIDDDEALQQAIALSLGGSPEISGAVLESSQNCRADVADAELKERKQRPPVQKADKRKEKQKLNKSRVQITDDQVIIHFFQFDDMGRADSHLQSKTLPDIGTEKGLCNYCGEIMGGGCMTRLLQHLAGTSSSVAACKHVTPYVKEEMRKYLAEKKIWFSHLRVRRKRKLHAARLQEEEEEDPEFRLQQDTGGYEAINE